MLKLNQEVMSIKSGAVIYYSRKGTKSFYELDSNTGELLETVNFNRPIENRADFEKAIEVYNKSLGTDLTF